ncbi:MAG: alpha/beta hydrolase, partial [Candidatus Nanopelagicales bacterium]
DESFNYIGKSYGTAIGTTYAALFPDRVGRMVLDGVLPTDLGLEAITKQQTLGFEASLKDFAEDCITREDCPFTGNADQIVQGIRAFIEGLSQQSLRVGARQLTSALASSAVLSYLYFPRLDYPRLRSALHDAVRAGNGAPLLSLLDERTGRGADGHYADNSTDAFYAVTCLDHPYLSTVTKTSRLAKSWAQSSPTFGAGLAWGLLPCSNWPAKSSEQVATVNSKGLSPILIVNTTHDPATPAVWGADLAKQLSNSKLITWDAYSHTAYRQGSECIDNAVDAYLLQGVLPTANLLCSGNN